MNIRTKIKIFCQNEDGATAIEYSLISATMGVMLIPAMQLTSTSVTGLYEKIINAFAFFTG